MNIKYKDIIFGLFPKAKRLYGVLFYLFELVSKEYSVVFTLFRQAYNTVVFTLVREVTHYYDVLFTLYSDFVPTFDVLFNLIGEAIRPPVLRDVIFSLIGMEEVGIYSINFLLIESQDGTSGDDNKYIIPITCTV